MCRLCTKTLNAALQDANHRRGSVSLQLVNPSKEGVSASCRNQLAETHLFVWTRKTERNSRNLNPKHTEDARQKLPRLKSNSGEYQTSVFELSAFSFFWLRSSEGNIKRERWPW
jgi:hypothetical protein